jgi:hypothetical protein
VTRLSRPSELNRKYRKPAGEATPASCFLTGHGDAPALGLRAGCAAFIVSQTDYQLEVPMNLYSGKSRSVRLAVERLEERDTPSTLSVNLGNGAIADAVLTLETGAGASGAIVGHAAPESGVAGTISLGTANQP